MTAFKSQLQADPERIVSGLADRFGISVPKASNDYLDDDADPALVEVKKQMAEQARLVADLQNQLATSAQTSEIETETFGASKPSMVMLSIRNKFSITHWLITLTMWKQRSRLGVSIKDFQPLLPTALLD